MPKRVTVTQETPTGRNERFHDNFTRQNMTRNQFIREINRGNYEKTSPDPTICCSVNFDFFMAIISSHKFLINF